MIKSINIAFFEQDINEVQSNMEISEIYENAQKNNLFYIKNFLNGNMILSIFSEFEMCDREYRLLFDIYNNINGFSLIVDNKLESVQYKYNIIDLMN